MIIATSLVKQINARSFQQNNLIKSNYFAGMTLTIISIGHGQTTIDCNMCNDEGTTYI